MNKFENLLIILAVANIALFIGLELIEREDAEPRIEITHPVEAIRCVSQEGKIVFCESFREVYERL